MNLSARFDLNHFMPPCNIDAALFFDDSKHEHIIDTLAHPFFNAIDEGVWVGSGLDMKQVGHFLATKKICSWSLGNETVATVISDVSVV